MSSFLVAVDYENQLTDFYPDIDDEIKKEYFVGCSDFKQDVNFSQFDLKINDTMDNSNDATCSNENNFALVPVSTSPNSSIKSSSIDEAPRQCVVCDEPTKCYHYDVPSCTGCKTFFRRCLVTGKKYKCQYGGKCDIKKGEDCRGCRFERCLVSGMNAAAIQYPAGVNVEGILENVKQLKRKLIEDNRPIISKMLPTFSETEQRRDINFLLYLEAKQRKLRESEYDPTYLYSVKLRDLLERASELYLADKFEKPSHWPVDQNAIVKKLVEQCQRRKESKSETLSCEMEKKKKLFVAVDLILTVEMAKVLPAFNCLSINDKEVLMKHVVVVNMLLTQSFYSYQMHSDVIILPHGIIPTKLDQQLGRNNPIKWETHCRTVECVKRVALNPEQFVLLKAIIYCHPAVEGLSDEGRNIVDSYHQRYSKTLLQHLQNEMGSAAGASKFAEVISLISTYFHFADKAKQAHLIQVMQMGKERLNCKNKHILFNECMI
uniref:Uncharacterized protein n=1 Tax=Panagrolaimus sp. JU765 TaxID=591449 RepID=A0AC34QTB6_9BILA